MLPLQEYTTSSMFVFSLKMICGWFNWHATCKWNHNQIIVANKPEWINQCITLKTIFFAQYGWFTSLFITLYLHRQMGNEASCAKDIDLLSNGNKGIFLGTVRLCIMLIMGWQGVGIHSFCFTNISYKKLIWFQNKCGN